MKKHLLCTDDICCLTGLSKALLDELPRVNYKTIEVISSDNVQIAYSLSKKSMVFLTSAGKEEIHKGVTGVLAEVEEISTNYRRLYINNTDEYEVMSARIKITPKGFGKIVEFKDLGPGKGCAVKIEKFVFLG